MAAVAIAATSSTMLVLVDLLSTGTTLLALRTMTTPLALIAVAMLDNKIIVH